MSYGRIEDGGLRCLYHGWLFDRAGRCLEQPGEPAGSTFAGRIRHPAYPVRVAAGVVFAYFGPPPIPDFPPLEALTAPDGHVWARKYYQECNYLQGNEGNIDPVHGSYLHRSMAPDPTDWRRVTVPGTDTSAQALRSGDPAPEIQIEETPFGVRVWTARRARDGRRFVRISNFVFPNLSAIPGAVEGDGYQINWHVPIDDTTHWKFQIVFRRSQPLDIERLEAEEDQLVDDNYKLRRNIANRYEQDRKEMQDRWFSGLGPHFIIHDTMATETQGPVQDRTREHLATSDKAIIAARRQLLQALADQAVGRPLPNLTYGASPQAHSLAAVVVRSGLFGAEEDPRAAWGLSAEPAGDAGPGGDGTGGTA